MTKSEERRNELDERIRNRRARVGGFTPSPVRRSLSTRGQRGETWRTKKHTPSRAADFAAALSKAST